MGPIRHSCRSELRTNWVTVARDDDTAASAKFGKDGHGQDGLEETKDLPQNNIYFARWTSV